MGERPKGLTIEREDNNGPYCKENCVWATRKAQAANTRRVNLITYRGETRSLRDWAELLDLHYQTVVNRHAAGRPVDEILSGALLQRRDVLRGQVPPLLLTLRGKTMNLREWSDETGLSVSCISLRLKRG